MNPQPRPPYRGPERRQNDQTAAALEERVRMLEELERAGAKSRGVMHKQIEDLAASMKEEFRDVADAINNLGMEMQSLNTHKCPVDDVPCPKADVPWVKQGLVWLAAGSVSFAAFVITWMLQHPAPPVP